jgi:hypothetical protein
MPAMTSHKFPDVVRLIQTSVPELKDQGRPPAEQKETLPRKEYGNSTEYLAARLKRDHPELLADATATVAAVLRKHGGDRRSEKAKDQGDNITLNERGTSRAYTLARLRRDDPDTADRVERGELP